jgi:hypothetical protein
MLEIWHSYWWVGFCIATVFIVVGYLIKRHEDQQVHAQFVGVTFIGCVLVIFNIIGILSAVFSLFSGIMKIFMWFKGIK